MGGLNPDTRSPAVIKMPTNQKAIDNEKLYVENYYYHYYDNIPLILKVIISRFPFRIIDSKKHST